MEEQDESSVEIIYENGEVERYPQKAPEKPMVVIQSDTTPKPTMVNGASANNGVSSSTNALVRANGISPGVRATPPFQTLVAPISTNGISSAVEAVLTNGKPKHQKESVEDEEEEEKSAMSEEDHEKPGASGSSAFLSHYRPPKLRSISVLVEEDDDLQFDKYSASKVYENFIKDAYYPVQRSLQQSRSVIEAGLAEPERDYLQESVSSRPIRTFARYNDDTHTHFRSTKRVSPLKDLKEKLSVDDLDVDLDDEPEGHVRCLPAQPNVLYGNRRYYSRYSNEDPDYFDYDLQHSVDLFRKQRTPFLPMKSPKFWEHQLFNDRTQMTGDSTISSHMFTKSASLTGGGGSGTGTSGTGTTSSSAYSDPRYMHTSYISSALRTPSYWEYRYQNMNGPYKP